MLLLAWCNPLQPATIINIVYCTDQPFDCFGEMLLYCVKEPFTNSTINFCWGLSLATSIPILEAISLWLKSWEKLFPIVWGNPSQTQSWGKLGLPLAKAGKSYFPSQVLRGVTPRTLVFFISLLFCEVYTLIINF